VASRCEHAKHTDGSKRRDQMGRDASLSLDLGCVSGNSRCELGDVGTNALTWLGYPGGPCKHRIVSDLAAVIVSLSSQLGCAHVVHGQTLLVCSHCAFVRGTW